MKEILDERRELKPRVQIVRYIDKRNIAVGVIAGLIILMGIIEGYLLFSLNSREIFIISGVLFVFYLLVLSLLVKKKRMMIVRSKKVIEKPVMIEPVNIDVIGKKKKSVRSKTVSKKVKRKAVKKKVKRKKR